MTVTFLNTCRFISGSAGLEDFADGVAFFGFRNLAGASAVNTTVYPYRAESADRSQWEQGLGTYSSGSNVLQRTRILQSSNADAKVNFTSTPVVRIKLLNEYFNDPAGDLPRIEACGNPVAGDWTNVFQLAALEGRRFRLSPQTTYTLTERIQIAASGFGLTGPRSAKVFVPAEANFESPDIGVTVGNILFDARGHATNLAMPIADIDFRGFSIEFAYLDTRVLTAIHVKNGRDAHVSGMNIFGGSVLYGIRLNTVKGGFVGDNNIHDAVLDGLAAFTSDENLIDPINPTQGRPQMTGIEIDGGRVDNGETYNSRGIRVIGNAIARLNFTGDALANANGFEQTDAINIQSIGESRHVIADNVIEKVGEGIDCFGDFNTITGNVISDVEAGLKLIHGASHNSLVGNTILRAGLCGIGAGGGRSGPTEYNRVIGNVVRDIDPQNTHTAHQPQNRVCCWVDDGELAPTPPGIASPTQFNEFADNLFDPGANGVAAIRTSAANNFWHGNDCLEGSTGFVVGTAPAPIVPLRKTDIYAWINGNQTVATGTPPKALRFEEVERDALEELVIVAGTSVTFVPKFPGKYRIYFQISMGAIAGGYGLKLYVDSVEVAGTNSVNASGACTADIDFVGLLNIGDQVAFGLQHAQGSNVTVNGSQSLSYLTIQQLG